MINLNGKNFIEQKFYIRRSSYEKATLSSGSIIQIPI